MAIITYTRPAKCKDCEGLKYYYKGKLKRHTCVIKDEPRSLNDPICDEYKFRPGPFPEQLKVYECKVCGEVFENHEDFYWHYDSNHNTDPDA